ncbi:MAG: YegS/Rv2252/BmrU family lipid kinase [Acidimicrobiia bacterium]|jgi:YegS/Rv2252/BmrU family lipid kinase
MTWWVIVNPAAGRRGDSLRRTRASLEARAIPHVIRLSESPEHVAALVAEGREEGHRRFVAVGGDGTAHLVLNGLMAHGWEEPPTLAILPAGSGSDFIKTFALPRRLEDMADHLVTDDVYRCDVLVLDGGFGRRYVLNAANAGIAAASIPVTNRLPRLLGSSRYAIAFWLALAGFLPAETEVKVGSRTIAGTTLNVVVANGQYFGGGMNVAPKAAAGDGKLEVQVFAGPRRKAFRVMPRVVRGSHLGCREVTRVVGVDAEVEVPDGWPIEADGELIGRGPVRVGLLPGAIDFKI